MFPAQDVWKLEAGSCMVFLCIERESLACLAASVDQDLDYCCYPWPADRTVQCLPVIYVQCLSEDYPRRVE